MDWWPVVFLCACMASYTKGQLPPIPGDVVGCAYKFNNNTYFTSPVMNIVRNPPQTIMFWFLASPPPYHGSPLNVSYAEVPDAEIFNTGDFQSTFQSKPSRIVFLYNYANASLYTQVWYQYGDGFANNLTIVTEGLMVSQWYHVAFYVQTHTVIVNTTGPIGRNYTLAQNLFTTTDVTYAYLGKNFRGLLDEVRIFPYQAFRNGMNVNNSWAFQSFCQVQLKNLSVDFYLNFDECGGYSIHNTGQVGSTDCWVCTNMDGSPCPYGNNSAAWSLSVVTTRNCTYVPPKCIKARPSFFGIPYMTLAILCGFFLLALLICGGLAAFLGVRYRTLGYKAIKDPHVLPTADLSSPSPPTSSIAPALLAYQYPVISINSPTVTNPSSSSSSSSATPPSPPSPPPSSALPTLSPLPLLDPSQPLPRTTAMAGIIANSLFTGKPPASHNRSTSLDSTKYSNRPNLDNPKNTTGPNLDIANIYAFESNTIFSNLGNSPNTNPSNLARNNSTSNFPTTTSRPENTEHPESRTNGLT